MAESILLPLLMEVAKPMVKVVASRVTEDIRCIVGFERELNELQENIYTIAGTVNDMIVVPNSAVERWLKKTIRIIHDAENLLDVLAYEKDRSDVLQRTRPQYKAFLGKGRLVILPLQRLYLRTKMGCWIRRINSDIKAAMNKAQFIKDLKDFVSSASSNNQPASTNTFNDDQKLQQVRRNADTSLFIGRDSDIASIVDKLTCNHSQDSHNISGNSLSVVAIVGIGGLGKSTLAKKVIENEHVMVHFVERIWISVSEDFNIERILNGMAEFLGGGKFENSTSEATIRKLKEYLEGKRYLLVLDDVWNTRQDLWDSMRSALESIGGSKDSMILTTTRDDAVAETMRASTDRHLSGLSRGASSSLFEQIAFASKSKGEALALEATGRKIIEKCKGVPLAIRSIAGILQKKTPHDWHTIEQSELWDIPHQKTGILPSLKLSYNFLSPTLKKCFSLCAFTHKGLGFERYELICRWVALGLLQNSSNEDITMEDIGEIYFNELLSISFLLVDSRNELGDATYYKSHDLVYDLARSIATHERLYLQASTKVNEVLDIQHLTTSSKPKITSDILPDKLVLEKLRSLEALELPKTLPRRLLVHAKFLRVLYLGYSSIEVVPESIAKLKCLKYLDLEGNPIEVLPEFVMELYNLQSLSLYYCHPLSRLPKGLSNLVNLRHLFASFFICPTEEGEIRQLSKLQTLPPLQLSEGGFQISELGCLHHVKGTLEIKGLELIKSKLDAERSKFSIKSRLEQLKLIWDNDDSNINHGEVLDGLHPNPNLKVLSIKGYGGDEFPSWFMRMNVSEDHNNGYAGTLWNLIKIELIDCKRCQRLPTLGHLSSLKWIKIRNMEKLKQIGLEFYDGAKLLLGNSNQASSSSSSSPHVKSVAYFASLKVLRLIGLGNLEEWSEPTQGTWSGFTSLEELVIEKCGKLKNAPNEFPILKKLIVIDMSSSYLLTKILSNKRSRSHLGNLEIVGIKELTHTPEEVGECTSLRTLIISNCPNLVFISNLSGLGSLRQLKLLSNHGLMGPLQGLESCKLLEELQINCCEKVETLPDLGGLSRLRDLGMTSMRKMVSHPPHWLYNLPGFRSLNIGDYKELNEFPDMSCLLKITSLKLLSVNGWEELQNLPEQLQHFKTLETLTICNFESVEDLPDWLGNLSSLKELCLVQCKRLKKLPSKQAVEAMEGLLYLQIRYCPLLAHAVNKNGPEYHKVACPRISVEIIP